jgi:TDG/mug DNA glycosylase family protein
MTLSRSFPPVVRANCRLLVLGSLPGAASLAAGRYYAHPRNRFWQLMGAVLETDLEAQPYDARLESLLAAHIGLWDVVGTAHRPGSLDSAIRAVQANDLANLVANLPQLHAVAFNGAKSHALGAPLLAGSCVSLIRLPSSSPANAGIPFDVKRERWRALRTFL